MNPFTRFFDTLLGWLKWPVAIVALIFLPGLVYALSFVVHDVFAHRAHCLPFLVGAATYTVIFIGVARRRVGWWSILEHELTHAVFAWATFHRVVGVSAMRSGGHVRYIGRGNWLIAIAPYFVPTFTLVVIAAVSWIPSIPLTAGGFVLGVSVAHHILSTWSETHRHQTDLREVGWLWSLLFLPSINAFTLGIILAYASGTRSVTAHLSHVRGPTFAFFHFLVNLLPK